MRWQYGHSSKWYMITAPCRPVRFASSSSARRSPRNGSKNASQASAPQAGRAAQRSRARSSLIAARGRRRSPTARGARTPGARAARSGARAPRAARRAARRSARWASGSCGFPGKGPGCAFPGHLLNSCREQVDELAHRGRRQPLGVEAQLEDPLLLRGREAPREIGLELLHQHRHAFLAPALVADRVLDGDFLELLLVLELHGERVGDRALFRVVIVLRVLLVLDAGYLRAQAVDPRVGGRSEERRVGKECRCRW